MNEELALLMEGALYVSSFFTLIIINACYLNVNGYISELLNCLFQFENAQPEMQTVLKRDKWIVNFGQFNSIMAAPILGIAYAIQRCLNPCNSATFAWFLLEECLIDPVGGKFGTKSSAFLIFITIFSTWIVLNLIGTFAFQCAEVFYVSSYCIVSYLKIFRNALNNCEASKIEQGLRKYRQLQILERFLNGIHQDVITGAMLNMLIVCIIISAYSLIHLGWHISIPHLILFSCLLVDCIATIVLAFGAFALVHTESTITLAFLKNLLIPGLELKYLRSVGLGRFRLKNVKKFVGSFYPLKVQIGNANFIEKTTPITVVEFCIGQTVNLLLMK
ncbi:unnamed protein product [Orchesella dallaii]|uniref:Gustatory receptor n=1 Tax=Orchesella dallaii TaxID=48710 RepID=A0ABP1RAE3_9HEXA